MKNIPLYDVSKLINKHNDKVYISSAILVLYVLKNNGKMCYSNVF